MDFKDRPEHRLAAIKTMKATKGAKVPKKIAFITKGIFFSKGKEGTAE